MIGVDLNKDSEDAEDLEIINFHATKLNEEAADVLEYQVIPGREPLACADVQFGG
jgi:hypothetical protein